MDKYYDFHRKSSIVYSLDEISKKIIELNAEILNRIYKKSKLGIQINKISLNLNGKDNKSLSNFFIFPTDIIYFYHGDLEEHIGFKISLIKREDITHYKVVSFNIKIEDLKKGEKLFELISLQGYKFTGSKTDLKKIMETTLKRDIDNRIIYTNSIGWVQGNEELHYVPITNYEDDNIICFPQLQRDYKIKCDETLVDKQLFAEMNNMLNITDKKITIPLFSYTILSSIISLINRKNKTNPEFMMCLHSKKETLLKEAIANLFCNVFKRTQHIYSVDSKIHYNQGTNTEILEKASKICDAPFINQISSKGKLNVYIKLMKQRSKGIILLSLNPINNDSVINLDINNIMIDQEILTYYKNNPMLLSTWFTSFIRHTQNELSDDKWGLDKRSNIDKFYKKCIKMITDDKSEYDINRLRHYAWLLVGYCYFLNYGLKKEAIETEQFANMVNEAIAIFRELSKIEISPLSENHNITDISPLEKDALNFLQVIDRIMTAADLIGYREKDNYESKDLDNKFLGLIDRDTLYIKAASTSNVFKKISSVLTEEKKKLANKNTKIYEFLYNEGLLTVSDNDSPEKLKKNAYAITVAFKNKSSAKLLSLDISAVKKFLLNNGCELHFLKEK